MTTIASSLCRRFSWRSLLHDFRTTRCRRSHGSVSGDHIGDPLLGEQTAGDALPDDALPIDQKTCGEADHSVAVGDTIIMVHHDGKRVAVGPDMLRHPLHILQ